MNKDNYANASHIDDQNRELYFHRVVLATFLLAIIVAPIVHAIGIYR